MTGEPAADPNFLAVAPIVEALGRLEGWAPEVYLAGVRLRRMTRTGDVGISVRVQAAAALARIGYPQALLEIAPLLADVEAQVRLGAARVLGQLGGDGAAAALHLKLRLGDASPDVVGAVMSGLLEAMPERYLAEVATGLQSDEHVEVAAIALGETRRSEAIPYLRDALLGKRTGKDTEAILVALAVLRLDAATAVLLEIVENGGEALAEQAIGALAVFRHVPAVAERVGAIAEGRGGRVVEAWRRKLG
jgi:HEAT repeat protein